MRYASTVQVYPGDPQQKIYLPNTLEEYGELWRSIEAELNAGHFENWRALMRLWSAGDNYFRLLFCMTIGQEAWSEARSEPLFKHPDHIRFARQVQFDGTDDHVYVGYRGFGKTTHFIADDLGRKLEDPNHASCWFSLTREFAQKKLGIIQKELEANRLLLTLWDDRFWANPVDRTGSAKWSLKDGLTIKRSTSRPEQSFEAHAFEASLPTGMHYDKRYYDDVEADESVKSDITSETLEARWISSQNLSSTKRQRAVTGTYYSPNGLMKKLETVYNLKPILYPGEDLTDKDLPPEEAGPFGGRPTNGCTIEELWTRLKDAGSARREEDGSWRRVANQKGDRDYGMQTCCDALAGEATKLDVRWLIEYEGDPRQLAREKQMNVVVCVDTSTGRGPRPDPTWIWVWGLTSEKDLYWLDAERKVLPPLERKQLIYQVCSRWRDLGDLVQLRIEQFGASEAATGQEEYHQEQGFAVEIVVCHDTKSKKMDRAWERWQPPCQKGQVFFPAKMLRLDERGNFLDLVAYFKTFEFGMYPGPKSDDGLDAGGLIWEPEEKVGPLPWPYKRRERRQERGYNEQAGSWASGGVV